MEKAERTDGSIKLSSPLVGWWVPGRNSSGWYRHVHGREAYIRVYTGMYTQGGIPRGVYQDTSLPTRVPGRHIRRHITHLGRHITHPERL